MAHRVFPIGNAPMAVNQPRGRNALTTRIHRRSRSHGRRLSLFPFTLESELACNTATGAEAARLLGAVREQALMLNWDPGNAAARGEKAYPDGYAKLPKDRIGHLHCKDVVPVGNAGDGKTEWAAMGKGII